MESQLPTPSPNQYRILIVDDQPENLEILVRLIEKIGPQFEILQVLNAQFGLAIAKEESLDLIITDWEMPEMDGITFIKELKKNPTTKDIPVMMCTGIMTDSNSLETAFNAGAWDYIRKPVDEVELRARLRSVLELAHSIKTIRKQNKKLQEQKDEIESLLLNILPKEAADELLKYGSVKSTRFAQATVLFTDFKGFTQIAEKMTPEELVQEIHHCFSEFDRITGKYGIEKIKTIGDAYMCAGGLPLNSHATPEDVVRAGLEIRDYMIARKRGREAKGQMAFELRLGIHTGSVVAGIVGIKKFQYDIWGRHSEHGCQDGIQWGGGQGQYFPGHLSDREGNFRLLLPGRDRGEK